MKERMNIVFLSSNEYARYSLVLVNSIVKCVKDREVYFYILDAGISDKVKRTITDFIESIGNKVLYIDVLSKKTGIKIELGDVHEFMLSRIVIQKFLPDDIDRAMLIGTDAVAFKDFSELYDMDFEGNYVIAGNATNCDICYNDIATGYYVPQYGQCFNADVLVYDLTKLRKVPDEKYLELNDIEIRYTEQGALNYLFWDKTLYMDPVKYNNILNECDLDEIVISHYATILKPWDIDINNERIWTIKDDSIFGKKVFMGHLNFFLKKCRVWWEYAKDTPYYDELLSEAVIKTNLWSKKIAVDICEEIYKKDVERAQYSQKMLEELMVRYNVAEILKLKGINKIAIYGMGKIGALFLENCKEMDIEVPYYIGENKMRGVDLEFRKLDQITEEVDMVVVCVMFDFENIKNRIQEHYSKKVIHVNDIFNI